MTEQEKLIAKLFDRSVESLGLMTRSITDSIDRLTSAIEAQSKAENLPISGVSLSVCSCKFNRMIEHHDGIDYCHKCQKPIKQTGS